MRQMVVNEMDILLPVIMVFICQAVNCPAAKSRVPVIIIGTYQQNVKLSIALLCQNDACISPDERFCILKFYAVIIDNACDPKFSSVSEKLENFRNFEF